MTTWYLNFSRVCISLPFIKQNNELFHSSTQRSWGSRLVDRCVPPTSLSEAGAILGGFFWIHVPCEKSWNLPKKLFIYDGYLWNFPPSLTDRKIGCWKSHFLIDMRAGPTCLFWFQWYWNTSVKMDAQRCHLCSHPGLGNNLRRHHCKGWICLSSLIIVAFH